MDSEYLLELCERTVEETKVNPEKIGFAQDFAQNIDHVKIDMHYNAIHRQMQLGASVYGEFQSPDCGNLALDAVKAAFSLVRKENLSDLVALRVCKISDRAAQNYVIVFDKKNLEKSEKNLEYFDEFVDKQLNESEREELEKTLEQANAVIIDATPWFEKVIPMNKREYHSIDELHSVITEENIHYTLESENIEHNNPFLCKSGYITTLRKHNHNWIEGYLALPIVRLDKNEEFSYMIRSSLQISPCVTLGSIADACMDFKILNQPALLNKLNELKDHSSKDKISKLINDGLIEVTVTNNLKDMEGIDEAKEEEFERNYDAVLGLMEKLPAKMDLTSPVHDKKVTPIATTFLMLKMLGGIVNKKKDYMEIKNSGTFEISEFYTNRRSMDYDIRKETEATLQNFPNILSSGDPIVFWRYKPENEGVFDGYSLSKGGNSHSQICLRVGLRRTGDISNIVGKVKNQIKGFLKQGGLSFQIDELSKPAFFKDSYLIYVLAPERSNPDDFRLDLGEMYQLYDQISCLENEISI